MFQFLMGVAFGAAGYWAWQSFGRDLLGMSSDQETTYGGFNSGTFNSSGTSSYGGGSPSTSSSSNATSDPTTTSTGSTGGSTSA
jgi:hypothetical protein